MSETSTALRYASALFQEAAEAGIVQQVDADVELLHGTLAGSRDLVLLFESPVVPSPRKAAAIGKVFEGRLQPLTVRFIRLLIEKQRENLFPEVVVAYRRLRDEREGVLEAEVRTAMPLPEAQQKRLEAMLRRRTGKNIRLKTELDASMIGGLSIRLGDTVYDGSVRHQLSMLRDRMEHAAPEGA